MILFTILAIMLVILGIGAIFVLSVGGAIGIGLFADVIVCMFLIALLMRFIIKKKGE